MQTDGGTKAVLAALLATTGIATTKSAYRKYHQVHEGLPSELLEGRWWWVAFPGVGLSLITENGYFDMAGTAAMGLLLGRRRGSCWSR